MNRVFNVREGLTKADDMLPRRFFTLLQSPMANLKIDRDAFEKARDIYYSYAGWDRESGVPSLAKLQELDIDWASKYRVS